jgi:hypothetical protein
LTAINPWTATVNRGASLSAASGEDDMSWTGIDLFGCIKPTANSLKTLAV